METLPLIKLIICFLCGILTFVSLFYFCDYFNVDEKALVQRLLAIKNRVTAKEGFNNNNYAVTRNIFQFRIFYNIFNNIKIADKIASLLEQADIHWQVDTFALVSLFLGLIPLILAVLFIPAFSIFSPLTFLLLILFVFMLCLPYIYVKMTIKKRFNAFTEQLPEALELLCNALRAGHSLISAFEIIVKEMPAPISQIFKVMTDQIALGIDTKDAMRSLQNLMPQSIDLRFFTTVVILQREIGGNLIKLLEVLSATIRERFKMTGDLKSKTALSRISGFIVSAVSPLFVIFLCIKAPEISYYLFNHIYGKITLFVSVMLMIVGFISINKITDIEI